MFDVKKPSGKDFPRKIIFKAKCKIILHLTSLAQIQLIRHVNSTVWVNPLTAKLFDWNFHPLEVVSRWRDPQLQVGENYSWLDKMEINDIFAYFLKAAL